MQKLVISVFQLGPQPLPCPQAYVMFSALLSPGISQFIQQSIPLHKVSSKWILTAAHMQGCGFIFRARAHKLCTHS